MIALADRPSKTSSGGNRPSFLCTCSSNALAKRPSKASSGGNRPSFLCNCSGNPCSGGDRPSKWQCSGGDRPNKQGKHIFLFSSASSNSDIEEGRRIGEYLLGMASSGRFSCRAPEIASGLPFSWRESVWTRSKVYKYFIEFSCPFFIQIPNGRDEPFI